MTRTVICSQHKTCKSNCPCKKPHKYDTYTCANKLYDCGECKTVKKEMTEKKNHHACKEDTVLIKRLAEALSFEHDKNIIGKNHVRMQCNVCKLLNEAWNKGAADGR